jgi:hypothetical protein
VRSTLVISRDPAGNEITPNKFFDDFLVDLRRMNLLYSHSNSVSSAQLPFLVLNLAPTSRASFSSLVFGHSLQKLALAHACKNGSSKITRASWVPYDPISIASH